MYDLEPLKRADYAFSLRALTDLHIGTGLDRKADTDDGSRVSLIETGEKDGQVCPVLPATALKGVMRHLASLMEVGEAVCRLFGSSNAEYSRQGCLTFRTAFADAVEPLRQHRTAINAGRGVADPNRLFQREILSAGTEFAVQIRLEARVDFAALRQSFEEVLVALGDPNILQVGAGRTLGQGQLQLSGVVTRIDWAANSCGVFCMKAPQQITVKAPPIAAPDAKVQLSCAGPYLTRDPYAGEERKRNEDRSGIPHNAPLRRGGLPEVLTSSLKGYLRQRADWLCAIEKLRAPGTATQFREGIERLFGTPDRRGLMELVVGDIKCSQPFKSTSVKIDRFSGGPIDNALVTTEADTGVRFTLSARLDPARKACSDCAKEWCLDCKTLDMIFRDLEQNGIVLGTGTTRGYGWFEGEGISDE